MPAQEQFVVRFPEGMRDQIKEAAAVSRRSMNAEILFHLERALAPHQSPQPEPTH